MMRRVLRGAVVLVAAAGCVPLKLTPGGAKVTYMSGPHRFLDHCEGPAPMRVTAFDPAVAATALANGGAEKGATHVALQIIEPGTPAGYVALGYACEPVTKTLDDATGHYALRMAPVALGEYWGLSAEASGAKGSAPNKIDLTVNIRLKGGIDMVQRCPKKLALVGAKATVESEGSCTFAVGLHDLRALLKETKVSVAVDGAAAGDAGEWADNLRAFVEAIDQSAGAKARVETEDSKTAAVAAQGEMQ